MENDSNNDSTSNKNNKQSSLHLDQHNRQSSSTPGLFTGNGGIGITSLVVPTKTNTAIKMRMVLTLTISGELHDNYHIQLNIIQKLLLFSSISFNK